MYSMKDLTDEITSTISGLMDKGQVVHPDWVTQSVMKNHEYITGDDCQFYLCTSRETVRDQVRRAINRYAVKSVVSTDSQMILEGFERLQRAYLVEENGEQVAIPITVMTDAQLMQKYKELDIMEQGCAQHKQEILRYLQRRAAAA